MFGINEPLQSSKEDLRYVTRAVQSRAGSTFMGGAYFILYLFLLFYFSLKLKLVFVSIQQKIQHILISLVPRAFSPSKLEGGKGKVLSMSV